MRRLSLPLVLALILLAAACRQEEGAVSAPTVAPGTPGPTATATAPAGTPAPTPTPDSILPAQTAITLTVWTNTEISGLTEAAGDITLQEQIAAFDADHSAITVRVLAKALTGQGSILNYLRVGRTVAPSILPDLVLIPTSQLTSARSEQLIFPAEALLDPAAVTDLFPAAAQLARVDDDLMGYPFAMRGIEHLAYQTSAITTTLPSTWDELVPLVNARLILPAGGPDIGRLLLSFYLAEGGSLVNEANRPSLDVEPLAGALERLAAGRGSGLILLRSSNVATLADAWQIYVSGEAGATLVNARLFLTERALGHAGAFGPVPGSRGPVPPLGEGWVWAISTSDPTRQQAATDLINWLITPENLGAWSLANLSPPGRQAAFDYWPGDDPYVDFLQGELARAVAFPATANAAYMQALADAASDVLALQSTPADAAQAAALAVQP